MADTRVVCWLVDALIMVVNGFSRMNKEDSMAIGTERLHAHNGVIPLRDTIGMPAFIRPVVGVDFLPQNRAFQSPAGFPRFFIGQTAWQESIWQQCRQRIFSLLFV